MDCCICFHECVLFAKCSNRSCGTKICPDCLKRMIEFCLGNFNGMPSCPEKHCDGEFLLSTISKIVDPKTVASYVQLCKRLSLAETPIQSRREKIAFVEMVRAETKARLCLCDPAIVKVMELTGLNQRLAKIIRKNEQKMAAITDDKKHRACVSLACNGKMAANAARDMECDTCRITTCCDCLAIKIANHVHECASDERESAKMIQRITKCPKCHVPAIRGEGCAMITCPFCQTNFHCETGVITVGGGHNPGPLILSTHSIQDLSSDDNIKALLINIQCARPAKSTAKNPARRHETNVKNKMYDKIIHELHHKAQMGELSAAFLGECLRLVETL